MSIKVQNPKNSILLEGLWGLGKTVFSEAYCHKFEYTFKAEPLHSFGEDLQPGEDLDEWYIKAHIQRQNYFNDTRPSLVERSILSSFAFLYALERPLPDPRLIHDLRGQLEKNKAQVVYMKSDDERFWENVDLKDHSSDIRNIIFNDNARKRYDEWFTKILPHEYGILPFILRATEGGSRRTTNAMVNEVYLALACERIAQINAVCFTRSSTDLEILVLKRNPKKGGFWQTITGGVHPSEDPLRAAQREVWEETSITGDDLNTFWTDITYSFLGDDGYTLDEYVFGVETKDPSKFVMSDEHVAFEWLSPEQAKLKVKFDDNRRGIDAVCKKIEQS